MPGHYNRWETGLFAALVAVALSINLRAHRKGKPISVKDTALWSAIWISLGIF